MAKQYVVTPSQMKKAEAMCEQKGTSCAVLMRNVGSAIALHISRIVKPCRAAVLVGSGNNGGDGFAVAHNLRKRGFSPLIVLVGSAPKTDLAIDCFNEYKPDYEAVLSYPDQPETVLSELGSCGIIIDCVYGTGFHGELAPRSEGSSPTATGAPPCASLPTSLLAVTQPTGTPMNTRSVRI